LANSENKVSKESERVKGYERMKSQVVILQEQITVQKKKYEELEKSQ